jgi:hypothetical protein
VGSTLQPDQPFVQLYDPARLTSSPTCRSRPLPLYTVDRILS